MTPRGGRAVGKGGWIEVERAFRRRNQRYVNYKHPEEKKGKKSEMKVSATRAKHDGMARRRG